ncbi:hypothetical protein Agub_g331 [Astrephomene gubernaculifera]|uniref:Calcineurin-like phosphoesterase domain-containing protein n=1 Tax=Astrephomene gubernaculifera TaxID=47775 RepID=A0AAD3DGA3_9CHLO|nr:hypothetical protein Agub_g331 [Astrephomene gubernaculifera]
MRILPQRRRHWFALALIPIICEGMRRLAQIAVRRPPTRSVQATTPRGCPVPHVIHRRIERVKPGRLIVVGDCHGCPELFRLLSSLGYDPAADNLILSGDLVNKGPASLAVLDAVPQLQAMAVRGNHDDAVLEAWLAFRRGGESALSSKFEWVRHMNESQAAVLAELPFTVSVPEYGIAVVHAGLVPGLPLEQQDLWAMYKMRNLVRMEEQEEEGGKAAAVEGGPGEGAMTHGSANGNGAAAIIADGRGERRTRYRPVEKAKEGGDPWATLWQGPPHVFFGHDAKRRLQLHPAATGLDTGCVYGGKLTAAVMPPLEQLRARSPGFGAKMAAGQAVGREELMVELVSVPAAEVYSAPTATAPAGAAAAAVETVAAAVAVDGGKGHA